MIFQVKLTAEDVESIIEEHFQRALCASHISVAEDNYFHSDTAVLVLDLHGIIEEDETKGKEE